MLTIAFVYRAGEPGGYVGVVMDGGRKIHETHWHGSAKEAKHTARLWAARNYPDKRIVEVD